MRLDFNLVVVDDDWDDQDRNTNVRQLIGKIDDTVKSKGFELRYEGFSNVDDANQAAHRRVDLFLSDNNLGNNPNHTNPENDNGGIDYYLQLKSQPYLCDFVLYTRSSTDEIVTKLANELTSKREPNLFSRFTFVSRNSGADTWHTPILNLLDHVLTKREELNNLRGLYAQQVSKMDQHLKTKYPNTIDLKLKRTIDSIPGSIISDTDKQLLHEVREIRNGLMHYDEEMCAVNNQYVVRFTGDNQATSYEIYENQLQQYRDKLNSAYNFVLSLT